MTKAKLIKLLEPFDDDIEILGDSDMGAIEINISLYEDDDSDKKYLVLMID